MEKYLNKNYKKAITSLTVQKGTAKDTGNIYYYLSLVFNNGYERRIFINSDSSFAFSNAFDSLQTIEEMDDEIFN